MAIVAASRSAENADFQTRTRLLNVDTTINPLDFGTLFWRLRGWKRSTTFIAQTKYIQPRFQGWSNPAPWVTCGMILAASLRVKRCLRLQQSCLGCPLCPTPTQKDLPFIWCSELCTNTRPHLLCGRGAHPGAHRLVNVHRSVVPRIADAATRSGSRWRPGRAGTAAGLRRTWRPHAPRSPGPRGHRSRRR